MKVWIIEVRRRKDTKDRWGKWEPDDLCSVRYQKGRPFVDLFVPIFNQGFVQRRWTEYVRK